jgi:hypothetical protein
MRASISATSASVKVRSWDRKVSVTPHDLVPGGSLLAMEQIKQLKPDKQSAHRFT